MALTTTVEHDGTEFEINLDALDRYGSYYVDQERGLIINASVYTHGTPDSRHLRGDVICGTDYTFEPVDVDREQVREYIRDELDVEISDDTLDNAIAEYQTAGIEVVGDFSETLDRYRILSKATSRVVSTDINEPLAGWDHTLQDFIDETKEHRPHLTWQDIAQTVLNALMTASPGDSEYSARITFVNATQQPGN
jgi:hypothetical protein